MSGRQFRCHCYSGKKLAQIGSRYCVTEASVSHSESSPGMLNKQHKDKKLGELVLKITRKLTLSNV